MCLGVPGQVIALDTDDAFLKYGTVDFAGLQRRICLACLPEVQIGDYVIVHAGVAINRLDAQEAQRVFEYLQQIGEGTTDLESADS